MAPTQQQQAIFQFIGSIYSEIMEIEAAHGMQYSTSDLRPPIEHYQDSIRTVQGLPSGAPVTIEGASADLERLRRYTDWVAGGSHVFLPVHDEDKAVALKKALIPRTKSMPVQGEIITSELAAFADLFKSPPGDMSQDALLQSRIALKMTYTSSGQPQFIHYPASEFRRDLQAATFTYQKNERELISASRLYLEAEKSGDKKQLAQAVALRDESRKKLEGDIQQLKFLWLQSVHPLNLLASVKMPEAPASPRPLTENAAPIFDATSFIAERNWQEYAEDSRRLGNLYANYTLLFAAALKDTVNKNHKELLENMDQFVEDSHELQQLIQQLMQEQKLDLTDLKILVEQEQNEEMKKQLFEVLIHMDRIARDKRDASIDFAKIVADQLQQMMNEKDKQIDALEKAHFGFLSGQLMVYQNSQDLVKKMAMSGLNIAGQFMENATAKGPFKGAGRGRR